MIHHFRIYQQFFPFGDPSHYSAFVFKVTLKFIKYSEHFALIFISIYNGINFHLSMTGDIPVCQYLDSKVVLSLYFE